MPQCLGKHLPVGTAKHTENLNLHFFSLRQELIVQMIFSIGAHFTVEIIKNTPLYCLQLPNKITFSWIHAVGQYGLFYK